MPPALGGTADQLVITATQDLRDAAVSRACLRAAGLDPGTCICSLPAR
jgi:hypothetical protein